MPGGQVSKALLEEREAHEKNNWSDGCLVHDGSDQCQEAEPRQEHIEDAIYKAIDDAATTAAVGE